jgi:kynurenine 3-monooxygenase
MAIALPNPDRSFTATLFWPKTGPGSFESLGDDDSIRRHFGEVYPDLVPLAGDLVDDFQHNPVGVLGTVRTSPWHAAPEPGRCRVGLLGDAAHAIVPFYGQGANCAFEDVVALDRCLDETAGDWAHALPRFEQSRHEHTDAIADMALANFVEMRDKVASPVFRTRKRVEHALERALPGLYVSQYELVSFSTVPYADVRRRVRRQQLAVAGLLAAAVAAGSAALG